MTYERNQHHVNMKNVATFHFTQYVTYCPEHYSIDSDNGF